MPDSRQFCRSIYVVHYMVKRPMESFQSWTKINSRASIENLLKIKQNIIDEEKKVGKEKQLILNYLLCFILSLINLLFFFLFSARSLNECWLVFILLSYSEFRKPTYNKIQLKISALETRIMKFVFNLFIQFSSRLLTLFGYLLYVPTCTYTFYTSS